VSGPIVDPASIDHARLRDERQARLQASMRDHGVEVCLLFNEPNIRYATGVSTMPLWALTTMVRCALVPAEGTPILFEHPNSVHRARRLAKDVRPMGSWEFADQADELADGWAGEMAAAMRELGVAGTTIALDRLGTPGFLALGRLGYTFVDSAPTTEAAREIKTPEEVRLFRANGPLLMDMLGAFEAAIEPGVRERDLLAVLADRMHRGGGEFQATSTVASGPNTNPWRAEATDRALESGDLVFVDTDTVGIGGAFFCVSRTFPVAAELGAAQRALYRDALEWLEGMKAVVEPGLTCAEIAARAPQLPEKYRAQRYEVMVHSVGLEEESPSVCYPFDRQWNGDRVIREDMVLVVELYAGEVGARDGVKLGDVVLVTADGLEVLAPYPYLDVLRG
jgi:Xaa-Pro aminopeptidase